MKKSKLKKINKGKVEKSKKTRKKESLVNSEYPLGLVSSVERWMLVGWIVVCLGIPLILMFVYK